MGPGSCGAPTRRGSTNAFQTKRTSARYRASVRNDTVIRVNAETVVATPLVHIGIDVVNVDLAPEGALLQYLATQSPGPRACGERSSEEDRGDYHVPSQGSAGFWARIKDRARPRRPKQARKGAAKA